VDDILEVSGFTKRARYWYFNGKNALILALLERMFNGEMRTAEALARQEGPAPARLEAFFEIGFRELRRFGPWINVVYEFLAKVGHNKQVRYRNLSPTSSIALGRHRSAGN
jgi:AcrR family transcriptional regulator